MKIKVTLSELLFYLALFLHITGNFFKQTQLVIVFPMLNIVFTGLVLLAIVVLIIKLIVDYRYDAIRLLVSIVMGATFLSVAFITQNMLLPISLFFFMVAIDNVPFKRVIMVSMTLLIIYMIIVHGLYLMGMLQANNDVRSDGKIRYAVGYKFVTFSSNFIFHIVLMYLFIRKNSIKWVEIALLILVNLYFYRLTDTKSALIFSALSIASIIILKLFNVDGNKSRGLYRFGVKYSVLISASISIGLTLLYSPNNAILSKLNKLLTERLRLGRLAFDSFPVNPFGTPIEWIFYGDEAKIVNNQVVDYLYADSSFVNMLLNYGLFMLLFVIIGFYLLGKKMQFTTVYFATPIVILALHSMFDPQFLEILYNPFILSLGYLFSPILSTNKNNQKISGG